MDHAVTFSWKEGKYIKLSDRQHSVINESSCLMLYRPIIHESIAH